MNRLKNILKRQLEFQEKVGYPFSKIKNSTIKQKEELTDLYILALIDELIESRNCYNKKSWIKKRFEVDRDVLLSELVDCSLFLLNIWLTWDCDVEEIIKKIEEKQLKNYNRLKDNV